ncbi:hypothetical protein E3J39_03315 [Candidatus Bathyarchaeota archaeon]|nr:MAG: hypothetical protein E3J39_03315 [Candidatus Bathyarchaeota archaeon]
MKRGKAEPLLDDVSLCVQMGWTHEALMKQPTRFVERLRVYLNAVGDKQVREQRRLKEDIDRLRRMGR